MTKKRVPVWQLPALLAASVTALGVLGAGTVKLAKFLTVNDRVEAAETKNIAQDATDAVHDSEIESLTKQNNVMLQQIMKQTANQAAPVPAPWEFIKEDGDFQIFKNPEDALLYCCDGSTCEVKPKKGHCPS